MPYTHSWHGHVAWSWVGERRGGVGERGRWDEREGGRETEEVKCMDVGLLVVSPHRGRADPRHSHYTTTQSVEKSDQQEVIVVANLLLQLVLRLVDQDAGKLVLNEDESGQLQKENTPVDQWIYITIYHLSPFLGLKCHEWHARTHTDLECVTVPRWHTISHALPILPPSLCPSLSSLPLLPPSLSSLPLLLPFQEESRPS